MVVRALILGMGWIMAGGTLLSHVRGKHALVRIWDFPRLHVLGMMALCYTIYALIYFKWLWHEYLFFLTLASAIVLQATYVYPYLPIAPKKVMRSHDFDRLCSLRLVISNVLQENDQYGKLVQTLRAADPDIIFAVEVNQTWMEHLKIFERTHPYVISRPQDNYFGMAMFSRLKLSNSEVKCIVQDEVPSIHTEVELGNGTHVFFHGLHPRPPEPVRSQSSIPRDAELVLLGKEVAKESQHSPVIVAGDLNDVAWSHTTTLFQRVSRLMDPRKGRGLYSTFHASFPFFRYPLDHVFHSDDFTLVELRVLDAVGSDHLPICISLKHSPKAAELQHVPESVPGQRKEVRETIGEAEGQEGELDGMK